MTPAKLRVVEFSPADPLPPVSPRISVADLTKTTLGGETLTPRRPVVRRKIRSCSTGSDPPLTEIPSSSAVRFVAESVADSEPSADSEASGDSVVAFGTALASDSTVVVWVGAVGAVHPASSRQRTQAMAVRDTFRHGRARIKGFAVSSTVADLPQSKP
jgi:hypothetical protein